MIHPKLISCITDLQNIAELSQRLYHKISGETYFLEDVLERMEIEFLHDFQFWKLKFLIHQLVLHQGIKNHLKYINRQEYMLMQHKEEKVLGIF